MISEIEPKLPFIIYIFCITHFITKYIKYNKYINGIILIKDNFMLEIYNLLIITKINLFLNFFPLIL